MSWYGSNPRDYMSRFGRTPEQQKYFDASGNVNSKYSSVASQQNPKPIYSFTPRTRQQEGGFKYGTTVNVYKKDTPVAAPAPAAESNNNNTQNNNSTPATINNPYADEIDKRTTPGPTAKDFITRFGGNTDTMAHSGLGGVRAAEAAGYSIAQIQQMGIDQGISFGSGAQTYFNQQRQKSFDDQVAAIQQQNAANLQQLTIDQNTRLDKMAADQQRRSDELAAGQRTYQQNEARASQLGALQIGGAAETPRTGGTQGFKRRKLQINPVTANALAGILGGTAAATTTNTLNV